MLRLLKEMKGYQTEAIDGTIGRVRDLLFDDELWTVRYIVATTGPWLLGRLVLIGWPALGSPNWVEKTFPVSLSREQIKEAPGVTEDEPVSREKEREIFAHFGWTPYWSRRLAAEPQILTPSNDLDADEVPENEIGDDENHLRSLHEVSGYQIEADGGSVGHMEDFLVDDEKWIIRYLVINTRKWLPGGKRVLVPPSWVADIHWVEKRIVLDVEKSAIEEGPEFEPWLPANRETEERVYDFHGRPRYWD